jgi:hypothetical protein
LLGCQQIIDATIRGVEEIIRLLREVAGLLMQYEKEALLEDLYDKDNSDDSAGQQQGDGFGHWDRPRQPISSPRTPIVEVAAKTVRTILCLCHARSNRIGKGDLNALDIGEELDVSELLTQASWLNKHAPPANTATNDKDANGDGRGGE